jgi:hypothetical protein
MGDPYGRLAEKEEAPPWRRLTTGWIGTRETTININAEGSSRARSTDLLAAPEPYISVNL